MLSYLLGKYHSTIAHEYRSCNYVYNDKDVFNCNEIKNDFFFDKLLSFRLLSLLLGSHTFFDHPRPRRNSKTYYHRTIFQIITAN